MDNLELWDAVERTDPAHVKPITGKAYSGNSPKPHYLIRKATETFGPCGLGWGFRIIEEKLLDGALLEPGFYERIHMARVAVWYVWKDKRGEVEHVGQTAFSGKRNNGKTYTDEDAPKKSVTDALVKALSMIGFAGDIFLGRWDDAKYVEEVRREIGEEKKADAKVLELPVDQKLIADWRREVSACSSRDDLNRLKRLPEFKADWSKATAAEREKIQALFTTAAATFDAREAA